jgi:hypothetical protein
LRISISVSTTPVSGDGQAGGGGEQRRGADGDDNRRHHHQQGHGQEQRQPTPEQGDQPVEIDPLDETFGPVGAGRTARGVEGSGVGNAVQHEVRAFGGPRP